MSTDDRKLDNIYAENILIQLEDITDSLTLVSSYTDEKSNYAEIHGIIEVIKRDLLNLQVKISELLAKENQIRESVENE